MVMLITRYNLSPRWIQILIFLVFYFICFKFFYINEIAYCSGKNGNSWLTFFDSSDSDKKIADLEEKLSYTKTLLETERETYVNQIQIQGEELNQAKSQNILADMRSRKLEADSKKLANNLLATNQELSQTIGNLNATNEDLSQTIGDLNATNEDLSQTIELKNKTLKAQESIIKLGKEHERLLIEEVKTLEKAVEDHSLANVNLVQQVAEAKETITRISQITNTSEISNRVKQAIDEELVRINPIINVTVQPQVSTSFETSLSPSSNITNTTNTTNTNLDCCGCFRSEGDLSVKLIENTVEQQQNTCCEASIGRCNIS